MDRLNLTDAQKKQLADLQKDVDAKLDKILTDEQKKQMQQMRPMGPGGPGGGRSSRRTWRSSSGRTRRRQPAASAANELIRQIIGIGKWVVGIGIVGLMVFPTTNYQQPTGKNIMSTLSPFAPRKDFSRSEKRQ